LALEKALLGLQAGDFSFGLIDFFGRVPFRRTLSLPSAVGQIVLGGGMQLFSGLELDARRKAICEEFLGRIQLSAGELEIIFRFDDSSLCYLNFI